MAGDAVQSLAGTVGIRQGRISALHALGQETEPFDLLHTPIGFRLNPQVMKVGTTEGKDGSVHVIRTPYSACLVPHVNFDTDGFLKLAWNSDGVVVGGIAAGRQASEVITPAAMAVQLKLTLAQLAHMQGPHPTLSELPFIAAREALAIYG
jgi:pyruvate/2-oxoglutarate dehydrogenase complex dihydrolipoamide dehydrogenase (E3) component